MYLTYHSYGQYVLYGWGYDNFDPPNVDQLRSMGNVAANAMRNENGGSTYSVGGASKLLYPASGKSSNEENLDISILEVSNNLKKKCLF